MSMFRKPKKIQRRVFSTTADEDESEPTSEVGFVPPPSATISTDKKSEKKEKNKDSKSKPRSETMDLTGKKSLLSFADDEDEGEVFQVRKSSHSKKVMRMLDKERRKKKKEEREGVHADLGQTKEECANGRSGIYTTSKETTLGNKGGDQLSSSSTSSKNVVTTEKAKCNSNKTDSIQTEIRTDDFVLVVKKSEPDVVLNGRAAFCAGRNDMSDEDEEYDDQNNGKHRFSKPEQLKQMLESGSIPDAAMIHAARKRRQKAREEGEFIALEEPKTEVKKGSRLATEDVEGDNSDEEERVDMNAITGVKEREERREQFYSVENDYTDEDSDHETHEWENQQIRKGVTGAQLVNAQQESVLSRFMIKSTMSPSEYTPKPQSTKDLLDEAYAKCSLEKPTSSKPKTEKPTAAVRSPQEIHDEIMNRINHIKELYAKHQEEVETIEKNLKLLQLEKVDNSQKAPAAAAKYRFYQEIKSFVDDIVDCLNYKVPFIMDLEKRAFEIHSKHQQFLIERRRQDVRDQAKEMAEASKPAALRRGPEYDQQVRRAAEREGRRTRRRCEREKNDQLATHLDGTSSDDEIADQLQEQLQNNLNQINTEQEGVFEDVNDEFFKIECILKKFDEWRRTDMEAYKDAFVNICLPKLLAPLVRYELINWFPILDDYKDMEKMDWFLGCMLYALDNTETVETLKLDPDLELVPTIIDKIVLNKLTEIVNHCWDPLSTRQTLRLIGFINRLGRDFPLKESSKNLKTLFIAIMDKMKLSLDSDVFIPIFPKQVQEAKTSFFQRQFCSGLKLFRNILSWQGIIADKALRELAIGSLLNRYLLLAMRVCSPNDGISKAYIIVNTLPTVWLQPGSETINNLQLFIVYIKQTLENCDAKNPTFMQSVDKAKQILQRLHSF